jgi:hypothetical protein
VIQKQQRTFVPSVPLWFNQNNKQLGALCAFVVQTKTPAYLT